MIPYCNSPIDVNTSKINPPLVSFWKLLKSSHQDVASSSSSMFFFYRNKKTLHHLPLQKKSVVFPHGLHSLHRQITCPHKMTYWQKAHLGILRLFASYYLRPGGLED